jgi:hypothetical protein
MPAGGEARLPFLVNHGSSTYTSLPCTSTR